MELVKLRNFQEFHNYQKPNREKRIQLENQIKKEFEESNNNFILGFCNVCEKATKFKLSLNNCLFLVLVYRFYSLLIQL